MIIAVIGEKGGTGKTTFRRPPGGMAQDFGQASDAA